MRQEGDADTDCHTCASHFDVARHEGGMSKGGSIESEYDDLIDIFFQNNFGFGYYPAYHSGFHSGDLVTLDGLLTNCYNHLVDHVLELNPLNKMMYQTWHQYFKYSSVWMMNFLGEPKLKPQAIN